MTMERSKSYQERQVTRILNNTSHRRKFMKYSVQR